MIKKEVIHLELEIQAEITNGVRNKFFNCAVKLTGPLTLAVGTQIQKNDRHYCNLLKKYTQLK